MTSNNRLTRVYFNLRLEKNQTLTLEESLFHYLSVVLRLKKGRMFKIFNQIDGEFLAEIISIDKKSLTLRVTEKIREVLPEPALILALPLIKIDRFLDAINSAIQLGVTKIIPLITEYTQYHQLNYEKVTRCIIEATEQSGRFFPAPLTDIIRLKDLIMQDSFDRLIFANEQEDSSRILKEVDCAGKLLILVGPEGGFSDKERSMLLNNDRVTSVSLSRNILRTETAVAALIACTQMIRGIYGL